MGRDAGSDRRVLKQLGWRRVQREADARNVIDGHVAFGALDRPDVGSMQAAQICKLLLADAHRAPVGPHVVGEDPTEVWPALRHRVGIVRYRLYIYSL